MRLHSRRTLNIMPIDDFARLQVDLGLPDEAFSQSRVYYNAATSTIVLGLTFSRNRISYSRIYLRHTSEERYRLAFSLESRSHHY
jgi:hypothetical protein